MKIYHLLLFTTFVFLSCASQKQDAFAKPKTYLALGDSYTIGESVAENERWPVQLVEKFNSDQISFQSPKIIAKTGWRTDELLEAIENELRDEKYDLVSVLIGVNNQYQGKEMAQFEREFEQVLRKAIEHSKKGAKGVFVVSIPDYGVTPFAKNADSDKIAKEISTYNAISEKTAEKYEVDYYFITDISQKAASDHSLLAEDDLHPSGKMYELWIERFYDTVKAKLK
ncbi:SGNH/GDSL hydrolase family protein [Mesonia sp. K7]|uniref:SGNH/GDSL hydrolase family protein n=1 Tax=Mesonia sp. K7 TaxID=2218606 RepID=UPI000DA84B33|nr:SGNH/GDSL hydrolase family protein [Mesonia sp. K7]PZD78065.1 SGNH/GDSL hydrolase family protein [Mesonia sp. K7]